jgi:hypothetical protein
MSDDEPGVEEKGYRLGVVGGTEVGVEPTCDGQDIFIQHGNMGQRLACLLAMGQTDIVRRGEAYYWRINHNWQVDELMVELIDLLISIRYAHPAMVQLEMILEPDEP